MLPLALFIFVFNLQGSYALCGRGWIEASNGTCLTKSEAFPPNPSISSPFCAPGWSDSSFYSKCYRIFPIILDSHRLAREFCEAFNATLVSITCDNVQAAIYELSTRGLYPEIDPDSGDFAWLGLTSEFENDSYWVSDNGISLEKSFLVKNDSVLDDGAESERRHCAVYDPTATANPGEINLPGGIKRITCEGSKHPVGNVICEQELYSNNTDHPRNCSRGWYFYEKMDRCYKTFHGSYNLTQRAEKCNRFKSELVIIHDSDELNFVANLILSGWRLPIIKKVRNLVWIGSAASNMISPKYSDGYGLNLCYTLDSQVVSTFGGKSYQGEIRMEKCESDFTNFVCSKKSHLKFETTSATSTSMVKYFGFASFVAAIVMVALFLFFIIYTRKHRLIRVYLPITTVSSSQETSVTYCSQIESGNSLKLENIRFIQTIGSGKFGCVFTAEILLNEKPAKVAVKRCRSAENQEQLAILSSELDTMKKLPQHPNVILLIGTVTSEKERSGQLYIIMELCEYRSLKSFLKKRRNHDYVDQLNQENNLNLPYYNSPNKEDGYVNCSGEGKAFAPNELQTTQLLAFSVQIANGLSHLAEYGCIHRDLAARNVLLTSNFVCKISDFGLARFVENNYYNETKTIACSTMEALPERWMAPESLENNLFSLPTDVWSFGIVLFELFSFGKQPYFQFPQNEVKYAIKSGEINEQPEYCDDQTYDLMKRCWSRKAMDRPSTKECVSILENHLKNVNRETANSAKNLIKNGGNDQQDECSTETEYYN